jgi:hypothetical protein
LRSGLWAIGIVACLGLAGIGLWLTRTLAPAFAHGWDGLQVGLALWRTGLFFVLIGFWPLWIERLARYRVWPPAHRTFVLAQRWRVAAWLILLELVLVQGLLGHYIEAILR